MTQKKVGIALSGGGARGFAHVGVLKALVENGIPIDAIAGTSAGSIVGGAFASGMSIDGIVAMSRQIGWTNVLRPSISPRAVFTNAPLGSYLKQHLCTFRIEKMGIPFAAVCYDLTKGKETVYREGEAEFAIRASCAVPGVFMPLRDERGHLIVDGGVSNVLPVNVAKELGGEVLIAVDVLGSGEAFKREPVTGMAMTMRAAMALLRQTALTQRSFADVVIEPKIAHIRPDQMNKREELMQLGEESALEKIPEIKSLLN